MSDELRRAGEARQMLDTPIFVAAKKHIEDQLAYLRRSVPIRETEMHTRLILMEQLWQQLLGYFELLAQTGKMAELRLQDEEKRKNLLEQGIALFRAGGRNAL